MAESTKIEWCDHTFNPWIGCSKVHAGCQHCYAETLMDTRFGKAEWGTTGTRVRTSDANWREPLRWNRAAASLPAQIVKPGSAPVEYMPVDRPRVFCASLADVFEEIGSDYVFDHTGRPIYREFDGVDDGQPVPLRA